MTSETVAPLWSSLLTVSDVPQHGLDVALDADPRTRARLAEANGLAGIASARADLRVARRAGEGLHVTGRLRAKVTQTCVVTLEPFEAEVDEPVDVEFEPGPKRPRRDARPDGRRGRRPPEPEPEDEPGMEDLDAPDQIVDGKIDLGALAAEFLTLGIDPYPRKPGVAFDEPAAAPEKPSPFSALSTLSAGRKI